MECERKVAFMSIVLLATFSDALRMPEPFNLTQHRIRNHPTCQQAQCILEWIRDENAAHKTHLFLNSNCTEFDDYAESMISLFTNQKVRRELVDGWYELKSLMFCPSTCTVENVVNWPRLLIAFQIESAVSYEDEQVIRKRCKWPFEFCKWWSYSTRFTIYFAFFAIPSTLILNFINVSTITKLISGHKTPAASLYFHKSEIYTDVLCSLLFYLRNNLHVFESLDHSLLMCAPALNSYIRCHSLFSSGLNLLTFINQCTLYNLVSDRCAALKDPLNYDTFNGRAVSRIRQAKTVGVSCAIFVPLLFINLFSPLFEFWRNQNEYVDWVAALLTALYAFAPVVCVLAQIVKGVQYQRLYEEQLRSTTSTVINVQEQTEAKRNEKEKRILLIGTVGLNIIASSVGMLLSMCESSFVVKLVALAWWFNILYVVSTLCIFMNGTGSFIIHIILLKSYRAAFWETVFGKIISNISERFFRNFT